MTKFEIIHQGMPLVQASRALILLHGRGSTASSILSLSDHFTRSDLLIAAPQAPNRTWYLYPFMSEDALNEPQLSHSIDAIKNLIEEIAIHIPKSSIYIMGFSQGACMALEVASRFPTLYGGVVAFTGGLIGKVLDKNKYQGDFKGTKVFIGTCPEDPHVPLSRCEESKEIMSMMGADVTLKVYEGMGHTIISEEIDYVKNNIF